MKITKEEWLLVLFAGLFLVAASYFMGIDRAMDAQEATKQDRIRIYCNTPGHSETFCNNKRKL